MYGLLRSIPGLAVLFCLWLGQTSATLAVQPTIESPEGYWYGIWPLGPGKLLRMHMQIKKERDGKYVGAIEDPAGGVTTFAVTNIAMANGHLRFVAPKWGVTYGGKWNADRSLMEGTWRLGTRSIPVNWVFSKEPFDFSRPQEPARPYPYREEEVFFVNAEAKVRLAGTLTRPKGPGPFPAVLLIPGSNPVDRDCSGSSHKPFLVLADHLTRRGIAVLRYDTRGVGKSGGQAKGVTLTQRAKDARAALDFLKSQEGIDAKQIGLVGHSEGGVKAPIVAVESPYVAFLVLLAPSCLPGGEQLALQMPARVKAQGADGTLVSAITRVAKRRVAAFQEEPDDARLRDAIIAIWREETAGIAEKYRESLQDHLAADQLDLPWERSFVTHDPRPILRRVACPVLVLSGSRDPFTPARENLREAEKALKEGGNKDFTIKEVADVNHTLQTCKTGSEVEGISIQETISPQVLAIVASWIRQRTGPKLAITRVQPAYGPCGPDRAGTILFPGDQMFFRVTATGVRSDAEGRRDLELWIQVKDTAGKSLVDVKEPLKDHQHLGGNSVDLFPSLTLGPNFAPGDYLTTISLRDNFGNGSVSFERTITCRKAELAIVRVRFTHDKEGYVPAVAGGTTGQRLYFRFLAVGFERTKKVHLAVTIQTLDQSGNELMPEPMRAIIREDDPKKAAQMVTSSVNGSLDLHRAGPFLLRITVVDRVSNKKTEFNTPLTVTSP